MHQTAGSTDRESVGWLPRTLTYGLVAIVLGVGLAGHEIWPLSGFRLFSAERTAQQQTWELVVVDESGAERPVSLGDLPDNYSGYLQLMPKLLGQSEREQQEAVDAWLEGLALDPEDFVAARLYLVESEVPTEVGQAPVEVGRSEMLTVDLP